jgi:hypothetical protein
MTDDDKRTRLDRMNLAVSAVTLLAMIGGWLWWGGRLSARVDSIEERQVKQDQRTDATAVTTAKNSSDIAATSAQFNMILTQLNRVESKVDAVRR